MAVADYEMARELMEFCTTHRLKFGACGRRLYYQEYPITPGNGFRLCCEKQKRNSILSANGGRAHREYPYHIPTVRTVETMSRFKESYVAKLGDWSLI